LNDQELPPRETKAILNHFEYQGLRHRLAFLLFVLGLILAWFNLGLVLTWIGVLVSAACVVYLRTADIRARRVFKRWQRAKTEPAKIRTDAADPGGKPLGRDN
jgi:hypothetical protein